VLSLSPSQICRSALCWLAALPAVAAEPALTGVWQEIAESRSHLALVQLDRAANPDARAARLARAAAMLDDQPVTDDGLREAEALLAGVATGTDELAAQAAYLQARLYQIHFSQPDFAKAAELLCALAARQPQSHWAQLGLVKLALLQLYALPEPAGPEARHTATEALLARITEKGLQRDLHLQLGLAGVFWKQPLAGVIEHLLAADRIGGVAGQAGEDLVVQIAELSFRDGQDAQARAYFERYLREYPVSGRCFTVRQRLKVLDGRAAAKGGRP
jgi:hypothetical protein